MNNMKINHIGYAVRHIDRAINFFEKMGYVFGSVVEDIKRNVLIVFGEKDGYRIELVAPFDKTIKSPVDLYLSNTVGIPYHICYECDNFDNEVQNLSLQGFKIVVEPQSAVAFGGKRVVFMTNIGFGLMEIVEK